MRYLLAPVRMVIMKKTKENACWWILVHCWKIYWECKLIEPLWKTIWRFLKKLKIELSYDPAIPLLSYLPKEKEKTNLKRYMHSNVHCSIIYNSRDMEATRLIDEWIKNMCSIYVFVIYMHMYIYLWYTHRNITQP